ncbi:MAG: 1-deoxy-D-xylulose-5-phosphate synthase [Clostridia bacterium]|nr:1-deoxy-D-xylulose-5-phosphate synthase [Clostridia bacterium]
MQLKDIHSPEDIKNLSYDELRKLSGELRERIISTVAQNGGHLASNLGTVEMTLALHRAFDMRSDKLIWDVGHQCYTHKILTGREKDFDSLRLFGGMAGFPRREESAYDAFDAGHASTAISAAVGFARARDRMGENHHVVAVVGDGALTGGMCYEALNDAGSSKLRMIVVLNDNEMSISHNVGAVSKYLTHLRAGKGWFGTKKRISRFLKKLPVIGMPLHRAFHRVKDSIRNIFVQDRLFDSLGFHYLGPVDGRDIASMERIFARAKNWDGPVLIHVVTQKGKGFKYAEENPTMLHGTPPFDVKTGELLKPSKNSMSAAAGDELCRMAQKDERVVAVTAAMLEGTGLKGFAQKYPGRLYDVGIAEEHAVTMAAGLACGGLRPFVAIYDTFLQRGYDQLLHDVCLQHLPVCFLVDRAGMSEDGATHHGIYGMSYLAHLPGMTVLNASSRSELRAMMRFALLQDGPVAIRYNKTDFSGCGDDTDSSACYRPVWQTLREGEDLTILATGAMNAEALRVSELLKEKGVSARVVNASCVSPLDEELLLRLADENKTVVTVEDHALRGGLGDMTAAVFAKKNKKVNLLMLGVKGICTSQGDRTLQLKAQKLDALSITERILSRKEING